MTVVGLGIVGSCGIGLVWATNALTTVVLSSIYVSLASIGTTALLGVIVNMFPTSLRFVRIYILHGIFSWPNILHSAWRTMTISVAMMFGRMGALAGNVAFPYLLAMGCMPPFFLEGAIILRKLRQFHFTLSICFKYFFLYYSVCSLLCIALPKTNKTPLQ